MDPSLSHLTLYSKTTEHFPLLPKESKALPPKMGALSTPDLGCPKAFPLPSLGEGSAWPPKERGVPLVLHPPSFSTSSSSLGELSVVINSVPFCFKIGLRKMPGCLIFKLNV